MIDTLTTPGALTLLGMLGACLVTVGKAAREIFRYIDKKAEKTTSEEKEARTKLEGILTARLVQLEGQVEKLQALNHLYLRRIYQLEATLAEHDIALPNMTGWPPQ